jgi:hypothetical protein
VILPREYLDITLGVRPGPNQESFNNIIYTFWYILIRQLSGNLTKSDLDGLITHIKMTNDEHGLYKPKNSHDNISYKLFCSLLYHVGDIQNMSFITAITKVGIFRLDDVITYGAIFGPKLLRPIFKLFLWFPALRMIIACYRKEKIRPAMYRSKKNYPNRYKWWFKKRTLQKVIIRPTVTYKHWKLENGEIKITHHRQNDGKHLAVFRLYTLRNKFTIFDICAKICKKILIKRYGEDYTYEIIQKYFDDQNHPLIAMWKNHGDIL